MNYEDYIYENCKVRVIPGKTILHESKSVIEEERSKGFLEGLVGKRVNSEKRGLGVIESLHDTKNATILVRFDDLGQTKFYDMNSRDLEILNIKK